jgi:hypothetical protein
LWRAPYSILWTIVGLAVFVVAGGLGDVRLAWIALGLVLAVQVDIYSTRLLGSARLELPSTKRRPMRGA